MLKTQNKHEQAKNLAFLQKSKNSSLASSTKNCGKIHNDEMQCHGRSDVQLSLAMTRASLTCNDDTY